MKRLRVGFLVLTMTVLLAAGASAATTGVPEWGVAFNVNGTTYSDQYNILPPIPGLDVNGFMFTTGLGQITYSQTGAGDWSVASFFDITIGQNGFDEYGFDPDTTFYPLAQGQSWEIGQPVTSQIAANVSSGPPLPNSNGVPFTDPRDDVSMAMGWNFTLTANQTATIVFVTADWAPTTGFYLQQVDPNGSVYFWSSLKIEERSPVPEPSAMLLLGLGLFGVARLKRFFG